MKVNAAGLAAILVIGAALGVVGTRWVGGGSKTAPGAKSAAPAPAGAPAAVNVEVAPVESVLLPRGVSAVGTLRSENSVVLRPEITGRISEINFKEGGKVAKGQVLVRLDDSVVKAQLQQAQANLSLAQSQNRRAQELSSQGFISKQARDEAASQLRVQQAAVALASAQLGKTVILAPFDGLIGLRQVSVGDYVSPGADLVPIESIDPLQVDFRVPEHYLAQIRVGQPLALRLDAMPGLVREGRVGAINPLVDVGGRSILLRADVPNPDGLLRPGMFSRVQLQFADDKALMVPEAALVPSEEARYVFRIAGDRVERRQVHIGLRRSGKVEVLDGLADGDQVVVAGLQKISDGALVRIVPSAAAKAAAAANGS
ncbi:efflux RND transporter periplasmic adaptor subunit [Eoetvoesiella caeni]